MPHASLTDDAKQRKITELTRLFLHQHYCENDTELLLSHLDDAFSWFGAGEHEYAVDPATVIRTFRAFAGRVPRCEIGEEQYDVIRPMPDLFICTGMLWVATVPPPGICLRVPHRITTVFRWTAQGPRCCHLHLSNPYSEMINPLRNAKRRKGERVCPICGAEYQAHGKNSYCSEACRREGRRLSLVKSEAKRKERRMQDKAKKDPRGGARPGAGRKKGGKNSTREDAFNRSVTLAAAEWEELGKEAQSYGISANKLAARIIRAHLAAQPSPDTE